MSWWNPQQSKIDPDQARILLARVKQEDLFPGVPREDTTLFEQRKCEHCLGLHTRKCPAVQEIEYHVDGKVKRVTYFPNGEWPEDQVIWLDDIYATSEDTNVE